MLYRVCVPRRVPGMASIQHLGELSYLRKKGPHDGSKCCGIFRTSSDLPVVGIGSDMMESCLSLAKGACLENSAG